MEGGNEKGRGQVQGPGRGRVQGPGPGRGSLPTGRGRGLSAPAPSPVPATTGVPSAGARPSRGRGLAGVAPPPGLSGNTQAPATIGRGRGVISEPRSAPVSAPAPAPAPSPSTSTAISTVSRPVAALGLSLAELNIAQSDALPLYKRPAKGTRGRTIALQSNLFAVEFRDMIWYKYDVEISTKSEQRVELATAGASNKDRIQSRRLNRDIIWELFRKFKDKLEGQWPAYDGRKTLILTKNFGYEHVFQVNMERNERGRAREFIVKLRFVLEIDVSQIHMYYEKKHNVLNPEILQATNIVIDSTLGKAFAAVNRSYYNTNATLRGVPLSGGKELRSGIYTSTVYAEWKPLLVVDKSNTAFYKSGNLIDYIRDFLNDTHGRFLTAGIRPDDLHALTKDLKGLVVKLKHARNGRSVKIHGLSSQAANVLSFDTPEGSKTVAKYFEVAYKDTYGSLKYPHLPCATVVRANGTKTDFYPLEVCEIKELQPYRRKLNPLQTQNMIRHCQEKPDLRLRQAVENVKTIQGHSKQVLAQHGIKISDTPVQTTGRQIESPIIKVKSNQIKVTNGSWRQDEFHEGAWLNQWVVVDCARCGPDLCTKLARMIHGEARKMKLQDVKEPVKILDCSNMTRFPERILGEVKKLFNPKLGPLMAVMILGMDDIYSQIKKLSETTTAFRGIITQCVKGSNVRNDKKLSMMFVNNLLKKMNVKLGGINNDIYRLPKKFADQKFVVIGADVSHPGAGDFMTPSIAAVVGSLDSIPSKYYTEIRVQTSENNNRVEYIKDLQDMAKILLIQYFRANHGVKPSHIYYVRDGVSDGQFDEVRVREITALRKACESLQQDYRPYITVLIAQKRHHTRFNVVDRSDGGKSGNVPPGTYIDRDVVHPENFDLYMYTHYGLLGTSRPTHYNLIHADEPISTDELTEIIYHLCHCYARTTSSVSIPAPVYYAHLAAFRAKEHVKGDPALMGSERLSVSSGGDVPIDLSLYQKTCNVDERYRRLLYYA